MPDMPFGVDAKDIAIFVAGAVVAVFIGYIFYKLGKPRKRIIYSVRSKRLVKREDSCPDEVAVTFMNQEIAGVLTNFRVFVWNAGNQPVVRGDLQTKSPPAFSVGEGIKVLASTVVAQSRAANDVSLKDMQPQFEFLNEKDGFVIDFFADVKEKGGSPVWLKGDIVGCQEPLEQNYDFTSGSDPAGFFVLLSSSFGILFGAALFAVVQRILQDSTITILRGLGLVVFGVLCLACIYGLLWSLKQLFGPRIPKELRRQSSIHFKTLLENKSGL